MLLRSNLRQLYRHRGDGRHASTFDHSESPLDYLVWLRKSVREELARIEGEIISKGLRRFKRPSLLIDATIYH